MDLFFLTKDERKVNTNTRQLFKHKYLHATRGITTEEKTELWSLCIKVRLPFCADKYRQFVSWATEMSLSVT